MLYGQSKKFSKQDAITILTGLVIVLVMLSIFIISATDLGQSSTDTFKVTKNSKHKVEGMSDLTAWDSKTVNGIFSIIENTGSTEAVVTGQITYYSINKEEISTVTSTIADVPAGRRCSMTFDLPRDDNGNALDYSSYKTSYSAVNYTEEAGPINQAAGLVIDSSMDTGTVVASITNTTGTVFSQVSLSCIYYQKKKPAGYAIQDVSSLGENMSLVFAPPSNPDGTPIKCDSYEIFVNTTIP